MNHFRNIFACTVLSLLISCTATDDKSAEDPIVAPAEKLPAISFFIKEPSKKLRTECDALGRNKCHINQLFMDDFEKQMSASKYFEKVYSQDRDIDYKVLTTLVNLNEVEAGELLNMFASSLTLLAVPYKVSSAVKAEFVVVWRDISLKTYEYTLPLEQSVSIFSASNKD